MISLREMEKVVCFEVQSHSQVCKHFALLMDKYIFFNFFFLILQFKKIPNEKV